MCLAFPEFTRNRRSHSLKEQKEDRGAARGGVSLRVSGVKVPRGTRIFFLSWFLRGLAFRLTLILAGRESYLEVIYGLLESSR